MISFSSSPLIDLNAIEKKEIGNQTTIFSSWPKQSIILRNVNVKSVICVLELHERNSKTRFIS